MMWRQRVAQVVAAASALGGLTYFNSIRLSIRAESLPGMFWDPRYLVFICAILWLLSSAMLGVIERTSIRHLLQWIALLTGPVGLAVGVTSPGLSFLLLVIAGVSVLASPTIHSLVIAALSVIVYVLAAAVSGNGTFWAFYAITGTVLVLVGIWLQVEFTQWNRRLTLFDQASWAAAQYAKVNTSMLNRLDTSVEVARLRERERIAREVHDTVGYALTASLVQLRAARKLMSTSPESADMRMVHVEEMVNDSLQDVRREVSNLRDEAAVRQVGTSRWRRLCEVFATSTGMRVSFNVEERLEVVSEDISEATYRIIQESLTNAYRHGGADHVDVSGTWREHEERILLRISDNGRGTLAVAPGNGLSGMRERVEQLNGTIVWVTKPERGFDIGVDIPWSGIQREVN